MGIRYHEHDLTPDINLNLNGMKFSFSYETSKETFPGSLRKDTYLNANFCLFWIDLYAFEHFCFLSLKMRKD